jgi:hypothetical protein
MSSAIFSNTSAQAKYTLASDLIAQHGEVDVIVKVNSPSEIKKYDLANLLSISKINADNLTEVHARVVQWNFDKLVALGLDYDVVMPEPWDPPMGDFSGYLQGRAPADWYQYPTYQEYLGFLDKWERDYPEICKVYELGASGVASKNHDIYGVRISDNVTENEPEPRYLETNTIHGDETLNFMNCLHMIDTLLTRYGSDARITALVDSLEMWFVPNMNPDGTYPSGDNTVANARRYNVANGWDLNRNNPCPCERGSHKLYGLYTFYSEETKALMKLHGMYKFQFAQDQHGGTETYLWPYGGIITRCKDENWYKWLTKMLVDQIHDDCGNNGYMTSCGGDGIGHIYTELYECHGIRCDMNDWVGNGFSVTLESSVRKNLAESDLARHWRYCKEALFLSMEIMYKNGLHGIVTDGATGEPLNKVSIIREGDLANRNQLTDSAGRYVTYMNTGTYDLTFKLDGYKDYVEQNFNFASYTAKYYLHVKLYKEGTGIKTKMKNMKAVPYMGGIRFEEIPVDRNAQVGIYDIKGKLIRVLSPYNNSVVWDGMDTGSRFVSSGCYVMKIKSNNETYTKNFIFNR